MSRPVIAFVLMVLVALGLASCGGEAGPVFASFLQPTDTYDSRGPYVIDAAVLAARGTDRVVLRLSDDADGGVFGELPFARVDGDDHEGLWRVAIPGRPEGSGLWLYGVVVDHDRNVGVYPDGAPAELLSFEILR